MSGESITGRDEYIVARALYLAARYIEWLPAHLQADSDRADMIAILSQNFPDMKTRFEYEDDYITASKRGYKAPGDGYKPATDLHSEIKRFLAETSDDDPPVAPWPYG